MEAAAGHHLSGLVEVDAGRLQTTFLARRVEAQLTVVTGTPAVQEGALPTVVDQQTERRGGGGGGGEGTVAEAETEVLEAELG